MSSLAACQRWSMIGVAVAAAWSWQLQAALVCYAVVWCMHRALLPNAHVRHCRAWTGLVCGCLLLISAGPCVAGVVIVIVGVLPRHLLFCPRVRCPLR